MKISKEQLRKIIKEEVQKKLRLSEAPGAVNPKVAAKLEKLSEDFGGSQDNFVDHFNGWLELGWDSDPDEFEMHVQETMDYWNSHKKAAAQAGALVSGLPRDKAAALKQFLKACEKFDVRIKQAAAAAPAAAASAVGEDDFEDSSDGPATRKLQLALAKAVETWNGEVIPLAYRVDGIEPATSFISIPLEYNQVNEEDWFEDVYPGYNPKHSYPTDDSSGAESASLEPLEKFTEGDMVELKMDRDSGQLFRGIARTQGDVGAMLTKKYWLSGEPATVLDVQEIDYEDNSGRHEAQTWLQVKIQSPGNGTGWVPARWVQRA